MVRRRLMTVTLAVVLLFSVSFGALAQEPRYHYVTQGQTLSSIARMYGVTVQALVDANGLSSSGVYIYVGQRLVIPEPAAGPGLTVHIVQSGESLLTIAARYGVTVRDVATRNGIANTDLIFVGQRLVIPAGGVGPLPGTGTTPNVQEAIIIANPGAMTNVSSPLIVNGWGRSMQNTLAVDVLDSAGVAIGQGFVVIDADPGFMGVFTGTVEFTPPAAAQAGRIQVYSISDRDGAIEHLASVEVNLQP